MKKYILAGCLAIIVAGWSLVKKADIFQPKEVVLPAISKDMARGMVKEKECYIVRIADSDEDEFEFSRWYYWDGKEKKSIFLMGNRPDNELSQIFMGRERNSFLVKGYVHEELTDHLKEFKKLAFIVEEWYLIAPIKRDYGPEDYRQEQRLFYPRNYLDTYDVEQGDYYPTDAYDLTWERTLDYYLKQDGFYKIHPRWNGSEREWFLVYDEADSVKDNSGKIRYFEDGYAEEKIYIEGNSPEYLLNVDVLAAEYDDQKCTNFFMVKGDLRDSEDGIGRLEIYKWWIDTPFYIKNDSGYWISERYGFSRSDIEAGIYKSYR
jgi:hypothetical protein